MNFHERHSFFWPKYDLERARALIAPDCLAAARVEPVFSVRHEALMDVMFERDGNWLVIPLLRLDGVTLNTLETPPISWPLWVEGIADDALDAIEDRLLPWIRSIAAARLFNDEAWRFFRDDARLEATFNAARDAGLTGAANTKDVFRSIAPAVYAQRFARGERIALAGHDAGNRLAALSAVASVCDADLTPLQARWFSGITHGDITPQAGYACYVGPRDRAVPAQFQVFDGAAGPGERTVAIVEPIPLDITVSFDPEDAPVIAEFAVTERVVETSLFPLQLNKSAGGSAGCVRLVVRDDAQRFPDADTDAADALAWLLRREGFDAEVTIASRVDLAKADIIHVFGLRHGATAVALLRDAEAARVPVVVTPYADDRRGEAGTAASGALMLPRCAIDMLALNEMYWAFARRKISNIAPLQVYDEASSVLMQRAASVVVTCAAEEAFVRERFAYGGPIVRGGPQVPLVEPDPAIGSLVGPHDYLLLHAPLEPPANQLMAVRAAQREGLPLVLLGAVGNIEYFRYIGEIQGSSTIQLRDAALTPAQIAGIYARARVVVDVGAMSRGLERLGRGLAFGAAAVGTTAGYADQLWGPLVEIADPMDLDSIRTAFRRAWERRPHDRAAFLAAAAASCDPQAALVATVSAYQQAAVPVAP